MDLTNSTYIHLVLLRNGESALVIAADKQNFEEFPDIVGPVTYFWKIAIPCTTAFFIIFSYSYIITFVETFTRRIGSWRRRRQIEERYNQSEK